MNNKYHFSLHLQFAKYCDIDKLEKKIGIRSYRKNLLSESKGQNKTAKLWFRTEEFDDPDTYSVLKKFINKLSDKFELICEANKIFDGKTTLTLYFEEVKEKPFIKLSYDDMKILSDNNISFEVDFRI